MRRSPRTLLLRLAICAFAAGSALLAGELLVRGLRAAPELKSLNIAAEDCVYRRSDNPLLGFELKPNYRCDTPDYVASYERTNAHGLRDHERDTDKASDVRRVILLGDSVVEGYGLPQSQTISSRLQELCQQDDVEVLNFGISAYCTRAEIELLEKKGLRFQPDEVVLVFVENDFDNFNREAFSLERVSGPAMAEWAFKRSHLFRLASWQLNWFQFRQLDPIAWNRDAIGDNNVSDGLRRFRELADRYDFAPFIAIWPRFSEDGILDVHHVPGRDQLIIEALAAMHRIPCFRLSKTFQRAHDEAPEFSPRLRFSQGDELHPSAEGARIAAAAISDALYGKIPLTLPPDETASRDTMQLVDDAIQELSSATPNYARVYNRGGNELLSKGKLDEAIKQYELALQEDQQNAAAYNNMGVAIQRRADRNDLDEALACYRRAIAIQPDFAEAHLNLGNAVEASDRATAQQHFIRAVQITPDFVAAHFSLSRSLFRAGRLTAAESGLGQVLKLDSNHVDALLLLATIQAQQQRYPDAKQTFEKLLSVEPSHAEALNNLAAICIAQGDRAAAIKHLRAAIKANPNHPQAAKNLKNLEAVDNLTPESDSSS